MKHELRSSNFPQNVWTPVASMRGCWVDGYPGRQLEARRSLRDGRSLRPSLPLSPSLPLLCLSLYVCLSTSSISGILLRLTASITPTFHRYLTTALRRLGRTSSTSGKSLTIVDTMNGWRPISVLFAETRAGDGVSEYSTSHAAANYRANWAQGSTAEGGSRACVRRENYRRDCGADVLDIDVRYACE